MDRFPGPTCTTLSVGINLMQIYSLVAFVTNNASNNITIVNAVSEGEGSGL